MSNERRNIRKLTAARGVASPRRGAPAFTLLELLVALTMTAIIAGSLYSGLRTAFRARTSAETAVEPVRTAGLTLGLLRADIESALPARGVLAGPFVGVDGTGEAGQPADALEFFTLGDPGEGVMAARGQGAAGGGGVSMTGVQPTGAGEARKVQICVVPSPAAGGKSEQVLVRRVTTNLLSNVTPEPYEEVLCRGVRAVNVRYFDGLIWQDNWDSTQYDNNIPSAVEVTIELERAGVDGQVKVMRFPRVFLLSCSTLTAGSGLMNAAGGTTP